MFFISPHSSFYRGLMNRKKNSLTAAKIMALGFAGAILAGSLLLWLPISSAPGVHTSYIDALFTATTSLCVTGLVTVSTFSNWSNFGHVIILLLIQLGGLGVVTCSTIAFIVLGKKITLKSRKIIQDTYNLDYMSGMVKLVQRIVIGTLTVEGIGAVCYAFQFIPQFGLGKGIWYSVFHSVSAFCNAGIDIIGPDSLRSYVTNPVINITTMLLIIVSGIGFVVWWDVMKCTKDVCKKKICPHQFWQKLQLHSKIAITTTVLLIVGGAVLIFLFEYNNPVSMGSMSIGEKMMASLFQSVTTRTAGFESIAQADFSDSSSVVSIILMFIGGSPMGTAGGVKTTTIAVLILTTVAYFGGKKHTDVFGRQLTEENIRTAIVVTVTGLAFVLLMVMLLSFVTGGAFLDVVYEVVSALGTVGLTRGFTSSMNLAGRIIIIISMYLGRIGPITLVSAVTVRSREANTSIERPEKRILIG